MLCKQRGVNYIHGSAAFKDSHTITVSGRDPLEFDHCILATGSRPALPKLFQEGGPRIMDSTAALTLTDIPQRLLVVGGGYIGLEMGSVYAALGSRVCVVEMTNELLPSVDRDLVRPLQGKLSKDFEAIHLNTLVTSVVAEGNSVSVIMKSGEETVEETFDRILVSVGRCPNSDAIGLNNTEVELDENGFVKVDEKQKTTDSSILGIGDVVGGPMLAHKASYEARVAVEGLAGEETRPSNRTVPAVVFTDPEIAWCGLTESDARLKGEKVEIARFPWAASGRAQALGRTNGISKLVLEAGTGRVLGVGIVGHGAGELIAEGV
ncbi:MAG: NAD(P)/FAD-dependent oxidoreductase, partial [Planctomycetota bacterium]|nr:NAD(P)/FAD-dependent oxidoreductase [Planctomycetota bacterium]